MAQAPAPKTPASPMPKSRPNAPAGAARNGLAPIPQSNGGSGALVVLHGWRFEFAEPLAFVTGRAVLVARSEESVRALAQLLAERPEVHHVLIEGHADEIGASAASSETLSKQRAQAVEQILIQQGIGQKRLRTQGYGKSRPLDESGTNLAHERNSRIEILVLD